MNYQEINLEQGMPTMSMGRAMLGQYLRTARAGRIRVMKIIHGYGSSGKGGVIRLDVRRQLAEKKQAGEILDFVPGEDFSPFNATARRMVELVPALRKDRDFSRMNPGITLVLLK